MSVAPTATAMEKVLAMLLKFDSGELPSSRMSLSYAQDQPTGSTAAAGGTTNGVTTSGTDSTSGYSHSSEYGYYITSVKADVGPGEYRKTGLNSANS